MGKTFLTSVELQEALEITGYDVYQYARRGLPQIENHPGLYDLQEAREWIENFGAREVKRESKKANLLSQLTDEEARIVSEPEWNAQYAVVWGMTSRRQTLAIQRTMYLMVQYSTSRAANIVYLSRTVQQTQEVQEIIESELGELAQGFLSMTIENLAADILNKENVYFGEPDEVVQKAVDLLENDPNRQEKYGLIYRTFIIEEFEKFTAEERRLFELLSNYYGEFMVNLEQ